MARADPEPVGQRGDVIAVERTPSMRASARSTVVLVPFQAGQNGAASGRQRRQGLKPARSAEAALR
jgi:hypothetical protein